MWYSMVHNNKNYIHYKNSNKNSNNLIDSKMYINIILTTSENIKEYNKKYRNINKETDVLSFPMFEKEEIKNTNPVVQEVLGDIVISISRVEEQAKEYGVEIKYPESKRIILWARRSMLKQRNSGLDVMRIYRMMGTNVLKYGMPFIK